MSLWSPAVGAAAPEQDGSGEESDYEGDAGPASASPGTIQLGYLLLSLLGGGIAAAMFAALVVVVVLLL